MNLSKILAAALALSLTAGAAQAACKDGCCKDMKDGKSCCEEMMKKDGAPSGGSHEEHKH